MSRLGTALKVAGVVLAVVVAGILAGWVHNQRSAPDVLIPTAPAANTAPNIASGSRSQHAAPAVSYAGIASPGTVGMTQTPLTNWEEKIEEILGSPQPDVEKAGSMLDIFPKLPEDGQVEAAQHLSNLLPDASYPALGQYLTNSATPEPVLDVLMGGLLNRPNSVKLPWLLEVARQEQNPKAQQAKDLLGIFLEEDNGKDWSRWHVKLDQWLRDNPD